MDLPVSEAPAALQRARGEIDARFGPVAGRTCIRRLRQAGSLKLRIPRLPGGEAEAVAINTAGGLAGGDRLAQRFHVEPGARLTVTTQACERVYAALGDTAAELSTRLAVGEGAEALFLPQETILFDRARLRRTLDVDCAATGRFLLTESVLLGREAMGETLREGLLHDRWRVRHAGRLVFADDLRLAGDLAALARRPAVLAGARAFATVLWTPRAEGPSLPAIRELLGDNGGAGEIGDLAVARLVADGGYALRARLVPLLAALSGAPLPQVWRL